MFVPNFDNYEENAEQIKFESDGTNGFNEINRIYLDLSHVMKNVDEKAMIRNRYNQIPYAAPDTKWERNAYNQDSIK